MKITTGQFNDSYFPIMDGVGMTAHNYAYWMDIRNCHSVLVAPKVKGYKDKVDYDVYRFKSILLPGMNPYRVGLPLIDIDFRKKIKKVQFDIIHAHSPFISGQLAMKISKKLDIPLIATFHTKYKEDFKKVLDNEIFVEFLLKMTLDFYNSVDFVWVPNLATGTTLKEYGFKGTYEIMQNGTDMEIPGKNHLLKYRKKGLELIQADPNEFIMLFVGQHRWEKNIRVIFDALGQLNQEGKPFKMVFAGEGYASGDMKKLAKQKNLKEKIVFLDLITERKDLRDLYAASDLFIFPSIYDNSPLVLQEAAAFDIPSIVVKNSSSAENIVDKVNGFLIENNSKSLKNSITDLMNNPELIRHAGEGARKSIYHHWESIVDEVHNRYKAIIKEFRSRK